MSIGRFRLLVVLLVVFSALGANGCPKEAPQSFDKQNGLVEPAEFDAAREAFEEVETAEDGLGIHFNANSCAVCHFSPVDEGQGLLPRGPAFREGPPAARALPDCWPSAPRITDNRAMIRGSVC